MVVWTAVAIAVADITLTLAIALTILQCWAAADQFLDAHGVLHCFRQGALTMHRYLFNMQCMTLADITRDML